jgi:hypothetical protein
VKETLIVIATAAVVGAISYIVCVSILRRALKRQHEDHCKELENLMTLQGHELTRRCQNRFGRLIADYNHMPPLPTSSRILGLTSLISSEVNLIMSALYEQQKKQGCNNEHIISMLLRMREQEVYFLDQSIKEWLDSRREILTKHNDAQGL